LAYQGKDDKKNLTLQDHATATREVLKIEIDEVWVAWQTLYKQVKTAVKVIASAHTQYQNLVLNFTYFVDADKQECQCLSSTLSPHI
jgi:hypothetical protein